MIDTADIKYYAMSRPLVGEKECGDQYLVKYYEGGVLIAVADGLGHGQEAAEVAKKIMHVLNKAPPTLPLIKLLEICHQEMIGGRGAVLTLVRIEAYHVSWLGVGNVIGIHWTNHSNPSAKSEVLFPQGGVVGCKLPLLRTSNFMTGPKHTLILATDGLNQALLDQEPLHYFSLQNLTRSLFIKYANVHDDALLLVVSWNDEDED